jgi:hypothetical protein
MNIFWRVPKIKTVLLETELIVFTIFGCLFVEKFENTVKFLLNSLKSY